MPDLRATTGDDVMTAKTCAACDCALDASAVTVKIGARTVEVCCDECAQKLREAESANSKKSTPGL
jgi:hypothetical protein